MTASIKEIKRAQQATLQIISQEAERANKLEMQLEKLTGPNSLAADVAAVMRILKKQFNDCLLYTSDAADE